MKLAITILILSLLFSPGENSVRSQDALDLLMKMDDLMLAPKDKQATVQILLSDKKDKEKEREAEMKQKGKDYRLYRYTKPESQAGIATLSLPDDVMWMYMPAFGKPKKISLLAKSQAFTGTDFSYEDMEPRPYSERYTATLLKTTENIYLLELVPIAEKTRYTKILLTLNRQYNYPEQMEFYDNGGNHFKTATYKYRKGNPYWYAEEVVMTDHKKNHSTSIIMTNVVFDQGIPDEVFDVENLVPLKEQ